MKLIYILQTLNYNIMEEDDLEFNIKLERSIPSQPAEHAKPQSQAGPQPQQKVYQQQQHALPAHEQNHDSSQENTRATNKQAIQMPQFLREASQPGVCVLHFGFKLLAMISYFLLNLFVNNIVLVYIHTLTNNFRLRELFLKLFSELFNIVVLILVIVDFWVVKNITGRKLVGLRWWNSIKEDGTEEWIYESQDLKQENAADSRVFWFTNYAAPAIWVMFMIANVLSFSLSNACICLFAFGLSLTNLLGFMRCEKNHKQKVQGFLMEQAQKNLTPEQMLKIGMTAAQYMKPSAGAPSNQV